MRILAMVKRIIQQMLRDKRALAMMMVAPLLIITLLNYLLSGTTVDPKIAVTNVDDTLIEQLQDNDIIVKKYDELVHVEKVMIEDELDGALQFNGDKIVLTLTNAQPSTAKALQMKIQQALAAENAKKQASNMAIFLETVQSKLPPGTP